MQFVNYVLSNRKTTQAVDAANAERSHVWVAEKFLQPVKSENLDSSDAMPAIPKNLNTDLVKRLQAAYKAKQNAPAELAQIIVAECKKGHDDETMTAFLEMVFEGQRDIERRKCANLARIMGDSQIAAAIEKRDSVNIWKR